MTILSMAQTEWKSIDDFFRRRYIGILDFKYFDMAQERLRKTTAFMG